MPGGSEARGERERERGDVSIPPQQVCFSPGNLLSGKQLGGCWLALSTQRGESSPQVVTMTSLLGSDIPLIGQLLTVGPVYEIRLAS